MSNKDPANKSNRISTLPEGGAEAAGPFNVVGSLRLLVSVEELEAGIAEARRRQAELFEAKMRSIME
jgi:hypothetical protein